MIDNHKIFFEEAYTMEKYKRMKFRQERKKRRGMQGKAQ